MLSLPSVTAPASRRRFTAVHSCSAEKYSRVAVPHDVGSPRTWQRSLYASGTPWNGPRESPAASSASSSRALARAPSASTVMKLRILASSRAMRSRHSRVTSTGETLRPVTGRGLVITGRVASAKGCAPLPGAQLEWWSANPRGDYDAEHRGAQRADGTGHYRYETDLPGRYPGRPLHLHVRVTAPGHKPLVTQLYPRPGQAVMEVELVLLAD